MNEMERQEAITRVWLHGATTVACACLLFIPGFLAVTAVMIPSVVVGFRAFIRTRRARRAVIAEARALPATRAPS